MSQVTEPNADEARWAESIGWSAAIAIADHFGRRDLRDEYVIDAPCADKAFDYLKGAVHFAEMAERGFQEELARLRTGEAQPAEQPLCHRLGGAMARLDFDGFDRHLREHLEGQLGTLDEKQTGIVAAAQTCGRTYQVAAVDALQHRARHEEKPALGLQAALLAGAVHEDELCRLLDVDSETLADLAAEVVGVSDDDYWLSDEHRSQAITALLQTEDG